MEDVDVTIIGSGAAGIGLGVTFRHFGIEDFAILERDEIGSSFLDWPEEMQLITPSFQGNQFGVRDLNAVTLDTSPGFMLQREHPTGQQYAQYLKQVSEFYELPVKEGVEATEIEKTENNKFKIRTSEGNIKTHFVVWAGGEYQNPRKNVFPGSEYCVHNSEIESWEQFVEGKKDDFVIIGGYESGIDSAVQLSKLGKKSVVIDSERPWDRDNPDPSVSLSSFTIERLVKEWKKETIELVGNTNIENVEKQEDLYRVKAANGDMWETENPPVLATGFKGSLEQVDDLFEFDEHVKLTENDESTSAEGVFLVGPEVRHEEAIFCFIYKYRQRFPIVAEEIAKRLNIDVEAAVKEYKEEDMYLEDTEECCEDICEC